MSSKHGDMVYIRDGSIVKISTILLNANFYYSEVYKPIDLIVPNAYRLRDIEYNFGQDISLAEIQLSHPEYFL